MPHRPKFVRFVWIALVAWSFAGVCRAAAPAVNARPNIIFFLTDDQRYDHMGCAGDPVVRTPNMDRLAAEGVRFTNAFVTTSICAASRATMFTGLYERTHKYTFRTVPLAKSLTDLSYPVLLRKAGYRTGFAGKFGVGVQRGVQQEMFDFYRPITRSPYLKKQPDGTLRHTTQLTGDAAIEFLEDQPADQPFCLSLSFNAPHAEDADKQAQYPCPKIVAGMYDELTIADPPLSDPAIFESQPDFLKRSLNRQRWFWRWDTPEKYQKNVKGYYRMISGIDHVIGRVREQLARQHLTGNTVILFAADNGYYRGSRGFAGKWSHYEESLRVPMIVDDPRLGAARRGQLESATALNVDIPATILDLAGVRVPDSYQGHTLIPLVEGRTPDDWRTDFFCEHLMHYPVGLPKWEGVRDPRWVYARYFEQQPVFEFLHDLKNDPQQLKNFASDPKYAETLDKMRRRCDQLRDGYGGPYSLEKFPLARPAQRRAQPQRKPKPNRKPPAARPANVVLIISDDQSWTDFGFLGHPVIQTPNLDSLAAQSATFSRGYVPTALCRPSLASIITGLYAHQHGITGNDPAPRAGTRTPRQDPDYLKTREQLIKHIDSVPTLPKLLAEHGYVSFQSGKWWEGNYRRGGFTQGMTHGDPKRGGRHGDEGLKIGRQGLQPIFDFIDSAGDNPFFVWYAPFLPHSPHTPPERLLKKYTAPGRPIELARYYAMCEWFDETCGELLEYLDTHGLKNNTLVAFVVDNGWIQRTPRTNAPKGWKRGFAPRSKQSPYEGGVRTPIMLRWPGKIRPRKSNAVASSIDLAPTILSACGIQPPDTMPGINLMNVGNERPAGHEAIFGEGFAHDIADINDPTQSLLYLWCIEDRWKLVLTYDGQVNRYQDVHGARERQPQLFDLLADPREEINRATLYPETTRQLAERIHKWWPEGAERGPGHGGPASTERP